MGTGSYTIMGNSDAWV